MSAIYVILLLCSQHLTSGKQVLPLFVLFVSSCTFNFPSVSVLFLLCTLVATVFFCFSPLCHQLPHPPFLPPSVTSPSQIYALSLLLIKLAYFWSLIQTKTKTKGFSRTSTKACMKRYTQICMQSFFTHTHTSIITRLFVWLSTVQVVV